MEHRLGAVLKRLSIQKKLGITPLEAPEEGFLIAMDGREQDPIRSMERLEHWLNIYGDRVNELDPTLKDLIELAKHELTQLAIRAPQIIVDSRATDLLEEIHEALQSDDPEVLRKKLTGIIKIHENDIWARPAVDEARRQLGLLKESAGPSGDSSVEPTEETATESSLEPTP
jgi:hypothetical protein